MTCAAVCVRSVVVNRAAAIELLPEAYAVALRLRDDGLGRAEIATRLGIAPEAVASTLELADAKLARLLCTQDASTEHSRGTP